MRELIGPLSSVTELVQRYGGAVSPALYDPRCEHFMTPGIPGVIGYRSSYRCAVALGDPVCAPHDVDRFTERFRQACAVRGQSVVIANASEALTARCRRNDWGVVELAEELVVDPQHDPQAGPAGRELRKKVRRAEKWGVAVAEYRPRYSCDAALECELETVASAWLAARHGMQVYINQVLLFSQRVGKRWFYATTAGGRAIGLLELVRLDARDGWVVMHLLAAPEAPSGTTEALVTTAMRTLGDEGCHFLTFGPSPRGELGEMQGVSRVGELLARTVFSLAARAFHLDSKSRYRRKFQTSGEEKMYLLFNPPSIGMLEVIALLRAFNVSLPG
jgi:lysylphosphatidylglycerol synthetase-like protein (DUF2156 family)